MINVLFVSPSDFSESSPNGGVYCSRMHLEALNELKGINLTVLSLSRNTIGIIKGVHFIPATRNKFETFIGNIRGYASYLTQKAEKGILEYLKESKFDIVFLDTSNFGRVAKKIKFYYPNIKIVSFFHNVEFIYAASQTKKNGLHYIPALLSSLLNEKLTVHYSDVLVSINERDKKIIEKKYNTNVSHVLSPWYKFYALPDNILAISHQLEVLFFGSYFYANIAGITWFIKNVLPQSNIHLTIAGRGMEALRKKHKETSRLKIIGTIDNIKNTYEQADCVVAPIFDGSGMKIKTGEALSFGKTVVGTHEAFTGYNITHGIEGYFCETAEQFVQAFKDISRKQKTKINYMAYNYAHTNLMKKRTIEQLNNIITLKDNFHKI